MFLKTYQDFSGRTKKEVGNLKRDYALWNLPKNSVTEPTRKKRKMILLKAEVMLAAGLLTKYNLPITFFQDEFVKEVFEAFRKAAKFGQMKLPGRNRVETIWFKRLDCFFNALGEILTKCRSFYTSDFITVMHDIWNGKGEDNSEFLS